MDARPHMLMTRASSTLVCSDARIPGASSWKAIKAAVVSAAC